MPTLDVTRVLDNPKFKTSFDVSRKTQVVGNDGRATETGSTSTQSGVVLPAEGGKLVRTPEGETVSADIEIVTKFILTEGTGTTQADIVTWNGDDYTVVDTNDFSEYGVGFIQAYGVKKALN